jgi:hypothetical protein
MSTAITIQPVTDDTALYAHYDGQTNPQPCHIHLDCRDGVLWADYSGDVGNGTCSADERNGHIQYWGIPVLRAAAANDLMQQIAPLAQRVVDGYDTDWDGNNTVAVFSADAQDALEEIEQLCDNVDEDEETIVQAWDAGDWLADATHLYAADGSSADYWNCTRCVIDEVGEITSLTGDGELARMEKVINNDAGDGVVIDGVDRYLSDIRDACRANTGQCL